MRSVQEHRSYSPAQLGFSILTASDSRTLEDDESGCRIAELVNAAGHRVIERRVLPDDEGEIRAAAAAAVERQQADVVVISGGSGFAPRDVSVEAVMPLLDREIEGFGQLFRTLSFQQVGAAAMLSRAMAGVIGRSVVFVLPGSPPAAELAMVSLILPEVAHLLGQIRR